MSEKKEYTTDDIIAEANKRIIDVPSDNIHEWSDMTDQTAALTGEEDIWKNLRMLENAFLSSQLPIEEFMRDSMERIMEIRRIAEVCGLDIAAIDRVIQESSLEAKEKYESEIKNMADALAILAEREEE